VTTKDTRMTDTIFTHDAATVSWDSVDAEGITVDDDGTASFDWSEIPVVRLDEPPHAEAFDTDEFYKIEGATVARPIKQPYRVGDSIDWYKKPADELRQMAWSLDNAPFTLGHPDTGMVKDVDDIHGFWKEPRYDGDEERLKEDLYIPTNDSDATEFVSEHQDVSVGFYNRLYGDYDGDTGDLTDDDVDGFQVQMYGDHVAGVTKGRCSSEEGCGLDAEDHNHGRVVMKVDESTSFVTKKDQTEKGKKIVGEHERRRDAHIDWEEGDEVEWQVMPEMAGVVTHVPEETNDYVMVDKFNSDGEPSGVTLTAGPADLLPLGTLPEYDIAPQFDGAFTTDYTEEGRYFAVAPDENPDDEPKFPINNCSDVGDAWHFAIRERGDIDISFSTLKDRIKSKARDLDCDVPSEDTEESEDSGCGCGNTGDTNMSDGDDFDIPDMSIDALAERHDTVAEIREAKDELEETVAEVREELDEHGIDLEADECPCDAIHDLAEARDEAEDEVEDLRDELDEYREEERQDALDELGEYLDDISDYEDANLEEIQDEIERVEDLTENLNVDVKNVETTDSDDSGGSGGRKRRFGRGHGTE